MSQEGSALAPEFVPRKRYIPDSRISQRGTPFVRILTPDLREKILSQTDITEDYDPPDLLYKVGPFNSWRKFEEGWGPHSHWQETVGVNDNSRKFHIPFQFGTNTNLDEQIKARRVDLTERHRRLQHMESERIEIEQKLLTTKNEPIIHELLFKKAYTMQGIYNLKKKITYLRKILENLKIYRSLSQDP